MSVGTPLMKSHEKRKSGLIFRASWFKFLITTITTTKSIFFPHLPLLPFLQVRCLRMYCCFVRHVFDLRWCCCWSRHLAWNGQWPQVVHAVHMTVSSFSPLLTSQSSATTEKHWKCDWAHPISTSLFNQSSYSFQRKFLLLSSSSLVIPQQIYISSCSSSSTTINLSHRDTQIRRFWKQKQTSTTQPKFLSIASVYLLSFYLSLTKVPIQNKVLFFNKTFKTL